MKKKIITLIVVIVLIGLGIFLYLFNSKDNKANDKLTKVTVAEPTLTSWTVNVKEL